MRKIIGTFFFLMFGLVCIQGQTLTSAQKSVKNDIYRYLRNKVSEIGERKYNEISFTYNGTKYLIEISDSDENPFFVTLSAGYNTPSDISEYAMAEGIKKANFIKGAKAYIGDGFIVFESEMYIKKAEDFNAVVLKMIGAIEAATACYYDIYNSAKDKGNHQLSSSVANTLASANDFYFPAIRNRGSDSKLHITKVHTDNAYTVVDFISFNNRQTQYCGINKNSYLLVNGKRYLLQKAEGISYIPNHTDYPNWKTREDVSLSFKLYFSPIPKGTNEFDFIEPSNGNQQLGWTGEGWALRGVQLNNSGWKYFNSEKLSTSSHIWECTAIQIQNGQTVLRKRVTPKEKGTYVYSDNEEYIEDADTGRKYYLKTSSISFKSSPVISYDTDPIDFAETYPALPSNVKRINISSGSQYYIKGLSIR